MTEAMIVEAVRSAQMRGDQVGVPAAPAAVDPAAVARFQAAMAPEKVVDIPFVDQVSASWKSAQDNHQGLLHRIKALTEMGRTHSLSIADLSELQYNVATLSFQQEVVSKVADKASTAVQTLVKNG